MKTMFCLVLMVLLNPLKAVHAQGLQSLQKLSEKPKSEGTRHHVSQNSDEDLLRNEFQSSSEANLSNLKTAFENEVLSFPKYFILGGIENVIDNPNSVQDDHPEVIVDRELLWNYLKFSSANFEASEGSGLTSVCMAVRAEQTCAICESAKTSISNGLQDSFKRKGFIFKLAPQFQGPLLTQSSSRGEKAIDEILARVSSNKLEGDIKNSCDGILYVEVFMEKKESENKELNSYLRVSSVLDLKTIGSKKYRSKSETSAFVLDLNPKAKSNFQSTQSLVRKIVSHQLVQLLGKKTTQTQISKAAQPVNNNHLGYEPCLEIEGVTNFQKLQSFKSAYEEIYPQYPLEERVIRAGVFRFAIKGIRGAAGEANISVAQIVSKIKNSPNFIQRNIKIEVSQLSPASADDDELVVVAIK